MSEFQVTFLEKPVIGRACRMIYNGQAGHTAVVTNIGRHPTRPAWLRVQTQTGVICQGPVQPVAGSLWLRSLGIPAKVALGGGIAIVVVGFLILFVALVTAPVPKEVPQVRAPSLSITAADLYLQHQNNTIRWDNAYMNRRLRIIGIVDDVSKDIGREPYVTLESGQVQCMFPEEAADILANLSRGDHVTIDATCDGYLLGVIVRDSTLVSVARGF